MQTVSDGNFDSCFLHGVEATSLTSAPEIAALYQFGTVRRSSQCTDLDLTEDPVGYVFYNSLFSACGLRNSNGGQSVISESIPVSKDFQIFQVSKASNNFYSSFFSILRKRSTVFTSNT